MGFFFEFFFSTKFHTNKKHIKKKNPQLLTCWTVYHGGAMSRKLAVDGKKIKGRNILFVVFFPENLIKFNRSLFFFLKTVS